MGSRWTVQGMLLVTGNTTSPDFPIKAAVQATYGGQTAGKGPFYAGDAFVAGLNATGAALLFLELLGGSEYDVGNGIVVASDRSIYVIGSTESTNFPVTSTAFQRSLWDGAPQCARQPAVPDAFVTKLSPAGSTIIYSTYLGTAKTESCAGGMVVGAAISVDPAGHAYVVGTTTGRDFPGRSRQATQEVRW